ncbi:mucin-5AC-like isoform X2 [Drosophila serrata]|uniref:mucin-5AC-like isoform X2 n=1 Tax=Drosophila serrata TaxID=7274 RepID=UPI000A1D20A7|nr:mucin-5AC-like isoform X2 [Drosophila serrata]
MNKPPNNKTAVFKVSRGSTTSIGPLRTQGPFSRAKNPLSARTSISRGNLQTKTNEPESLDQASTSPMALPGFLDRPSANCDPIQARGSLPNAAELLYSAEVSGNRRPSQIRGPLPKTKIPVFSGNGNQGSASRNPGPAQKPGSILSDEASASPSRGSAAKTKIPIFSESRIRGSASTSPGPVQTPGLNANNPIDTSQPCESPSPVQAQERKITEPLSSGSRNRESGFRYPGLIQTQGPFLSSRTPTSPDIFQNRRPISKASESVSSAVRTRGSLSTSPSYIRRPKSSVPVNTDPASAGVSRLQSRGPNATKPVPSVSRNASRNPDPLQAKGPLPKSSEPVSSVKRNCGSVSTSRGSGLKSTGQVSSQASASPVPAQPPGLTANKSLTRKNQDFASKRPGNLTNTKKQITSPARRPDPAKPKGKQIRNMEPELSSKQNIKSSPPTSPGRKSELAPTTSLSFETQLADELDKRNRSIIELEMKLVQNQNLVSEQALRLAESKAVQTAKDAAMEQLKSELLTAKDEYDRMHLRLKDADLGLEQATCKVNKYLERSTSFEDELKKARDMINNLQGQLKDANTNAEIHCQSKAQLQQDVERMQGQLTLDSDRILSLQQTEKDLTEDLEKKERLINKINHELATRDEEFRNLFETLQNKHTQLRNQELSIKRLEERNERSSLNRSKLEERNSALLDKIDRLKHNLRNYSQMIIASDGKPFFEEVPTRINPDVADGLEESQQKRMPKHREK